MHLVAAGAWRRNESDGVDAFRASIVEPDHLRVWVRVWMVEDQSLRVGSVDLRAEANGVWARAIYFDALESSDPLRPFRASQRKNLFEYLSDPGEAEW